MTVKFAWLVVELEYTDGEELTRFLPLRVDLGPMGALQDAVDRGFIPARHFACCRMSAWDHSRPVVGPEAPSVTFTVD